MDMNECLEVNEQETCRQGNNGVFQDLQLLSSLKYSVQLRNS